MEELKQDKDDVEEEQKEVEEAGQEQGGKKLR